MGIRGPRHLLDYPRFKLDVGVRCLRCHRMAVFDPAEVLRHFITISQPTTLPLTARPFFCRCGSREVRTLPVPSWERPAQLPARRPILQPIYVRDPERRT